MRFVRACSQRGASTEPTPDGLPPQDTVAPASCGEPSSHLEASSHAEPSSHPEADSDAEPASVAEPASAAASLPQDLLGSIFHLLLKFPKDLISFSSWSPWSVRQVCAHWQACFDAQLLREDAIDIDEELCLPAGQEAMQSWLRHFAASRTAALLGRASRLRLRFSCELVTELIEDDEVVGHGYNFEDDDATLAMNKAVIQAACSLAHLDFTLTASLADEVDILLPRSSRLTSLCLTYRAYDHMASEVDYSKNGSLAALAVSVRRLPALQKLVVQDLPADPFVLSVLAPSLPRSLTRLELQLATDLERYTTDAIGDECSGTLQQLGGLPRLRDLRLFSAITGRLDNRVPPGLSLLTCLEVHGHTDHVGSLVSSLALMPHLQRLSWENTGMLYLGWPDSIASLTQLTYLSLREPILPSVEHWQVPPAPPPPSLAGHTRLAHLHIDGLRGEVLWVMPDLRPLAPSLRCLRCGHCTGEVIRQALPALSHLTALALDSCIPWPVGGPEVLAHIRDLQCLIENRGWTYNELCPEHWPPSEDGVCLGLF